jgi:hypothetical protein
MERQSTIRNYTVNQCISAGCGCWKSDECCDVNAVMHKFHWSPVDQIYSSRNNTNYKFVFNLKFSQMSVICIDANEHQRLIETGLIPDEDKKSMKYKFIMDDYIFKQTHYHIPIWCGNKCLECCYVYNPDNLDECNENFII